MMHVGTLKEMPYECTEDGQNNGNTIHYRNKTVLATLKEHYLYLSILYLRYVVSMHYRLCLVTVRMNVLQNGRLVRFLKGTLLARV